MPHDMNADTLKQATARIRELEGERELMQIVRERITEARQKAEAERDALAAQVAGLRAALEEALGRCRNSAEGAALGDLADIRNYVFSDMRRCVDGITTALALPLPAAAERVKDWREKAERLDDWATKWEDYVKAPSWGDSKERESFIEADTNLRRYARELRAARGAK
jgi:hypothetical protein